MTLESSNKGEEDDNVYYIPRELLGGFPFSDEKYVKQVTTKFIMDNKELFDKLAKE